MVAVMRNSPVISSAKKNLRIRFISFGEADAPRIYGEGTGSKFASGAALNQTHGLRGEALAILSARRPAKT